MPIKKQKKNQSNGKNSNGKITNGKKLNNKKRCNEIKVRKICSEMGRTEPVPQPPDPMEDPLYRYRQPKLIDFDQILDPNPLFPEGNIVILMKLLKKKPIPGILYDGTEYDWYGL